MIRVLVDAIYTLLVVLGVVGGAFVTRAVLAWRTRRMFSAPLPAGVASRSPMSRAQRRRERQRRGR